MSTDLQAVLDTVGNQDPGVTPDSDPTPAVPESTPGHLPDLWPDGHPVDRLASQPPKANPERYEYWQSQADKFRRENEALKAQLEATAQRDPLPSEPLEPKPRSSSLTRPVPPTKPVQYSVADAISDPTSASYVYREAMDRYNEELAAYLEARDRLRDEELERTQRETRMKAEHDRAIGQVKELLLVQHGLTPAEVQEFFTVLSDPKAFGLDSFVALYRHKTGKQRTAAKEPLSAISPPPVTLGGGSAPPKVNLTEEDQFNLELLRAGKGRR